MILPLLCASLLASAAVAPGVLPRNEDFSISNDSMLVRRNLIHDGNDQVLNFPISAPDIDVYFVIQLPFQEYFDDNGDSYLINTDVSSGVAPVSCSWGFEVLPEGAFRGTGGVVTLHETYFSCEFHDGKQDEVWESLSDFSLSVVFEISGDNVTFNFNCVLGDSDDSTAVLSYAGVLTPVYNEDGFDYDLVVPAPTSPDGVAIVGEIVSILGAGIGQLGSSIGQGVATFAQSLAFDGNGNLSIYFIMVISLASVSLAIALTTRIFTWLTSLGN